jgi:TolB-like protein/DNA-binding winged helix-turn-helix (wHTH) protein/Flp pilus assembly protein TadD
MSDEVGRGHGSRNIRPPLSAVRERTHTDTHEVYEFGPFRLDPKERKLLRGSEIVALTPRAFDTLLLLVRNSGHLLEKNELIRQLWPDSFVEEGNLSNNIFLLRKALGEDPQYIETIPKKGYRFVGAVRQPSNTKTLPSIDGPPLQSTYAVPAQPPGAPLEAPIRRLTLTFAAISLAVLAIAAIAWRVSHGRRIAPPSGPQIRSLAVLPLTNLSGDTAQDYFSDGLTETLTNDLGKFSVLRVISRTSAMQYKGTKKAVPEIARDLNVDAVIEGTVLRSGNHVRITVNLIQAQPEKHLWAESYDAEAGDILNVQAAVAQSVAQEIKVTLTPPAHPPLKSQTVNPEAQDLYFRGLHAWNSGTSEGTQNAINYFQRSIDKDPNFAPTYAGLALVYSDWRPGDSGPQENMPKARKAAKKALALDETLPMVHSVLGSIALYFDWNWAGAENEFKRALALDPNHYLTHNTYARELVALGRTDEALTHVKEAMSLDPFWQGDYPIWITYLGRRYNDALQLAKVKSAEDPNNPWYHFNLALIYGQQGKSMESVEEYLKFETLSGTDPQTIARLREAFAKSGPDGFWRRRLEEYRKAARSQYVSNGMVAEACLRVGEKQCAFESLEKAFHERDDLMINLNVDPAFDAIRTDPRFQDLVRRVGLPEVKPQN